MSGELWWDTSLASKKVYFQFHNQEENIKSSVAFCFFVIIPEMIDCISKLDLPSYYISPSG